MAPKVPVMRLLISLPRDCAQSSMMGFSLAISNSFVISHVLPNMCTAITASRLFRFRCKSSGDMQHVSRSTSMKQCLQPAALIALNTTGQQ